MREAAMKRPERNGSCEWRHFRRAAGRCERRRSRRQAAALLCTAALVLSAAGASCISLKVRPLEDPHVRIEILAACREIADDGETLAPLEIAAAFSGESPVICFLKLVDIPQAVTLRWTWYAPDGTLVRNTGDIAVNTEDEYLGSISAYDRLDPREMDGRTGRWTAAVFINGELAGTVAFEVH